MSEVIAAALSCYRRYPLVFAGLALAVVVPYGLIVRAAEGSSLLSTRHAAAGTQLTLTLIDLLLVGPLISALHIHALVAIGEGRRPSLAAVARLGLRVIPVVAAAEIVAGIGIAIGLVLLIVPGVILAIRWAVVAQAAAVEPGSWVDALRRSGELSEGNYRHVFGVLILVAIIELVITALLGAGVGNGAGAGEVLLGIIVETITRSIAALTTAVLYFDLLARRNPGGRGADPPVPNDLDGLG